MNSKLLFEIVERIKGMSSIKIFVIFAMRTLDFAVMPWCIRTNKLMLYATLFEASLEQCGSAALGGKKPLCELGSVISLNALYGKRKSLYQMLKEDHGGVCTILLTVCRKSHHIRWLFCVIYGIIEAEKDRR